MYCVRVTFINSYASKGIVKLRLLIGLILSMVISEVSAGEEYKNPVDGKTYVTEEWKTYHPKNPHKKTEKRVMNSGIRLLTTEDEIDRNLTVDQLAGYIKAIEEQANITIKGIESSGIVLLQASLNPGAVAEYQMSFQGDLSQEYLQKFYDALQKLNFPKVRVSNVSFQVEFIVKQGITKQ